MATLRYFIRVSKKSPIANIRIRFKQGNKFDLAALTPYSIKPQFWNNKTGKPREIAEYTDYSKTVKRLEKLKRFLIDEFIELTDISKMNSDWLTSTIDRYFNPEKHIQRGTSLYSYIQHFVDNSNKRLNPKTGNPVCYKMQREYQVTYDYLKKYAEKYKEPDFIDMDMEFYQNFTELLRDEGLRTNTIGKKIQTLKIFLNAATEDGINQYMKYKSKNFKAISEEADNVYLDIDELDKFYNYDLSDKPSLERVRDLFIISCWTGLRYSDLFQITQDRIENGLLMVKQTKTMGKIWIPLHPVVNQILNKYDNKLPSTISNQKYNDYLRDAAEEAKIKTPYIKSFFKNGLRVEKKFKKYELISSHTARRSFCTNAYEMDIPTITIMAISGHKSEQAFLKYIKTDGKRHAQKMKEMWQKKGIYLSVAK